MADPTRPHPTSADDLAGPETPVPDGDESPTRDGAALAQLRRAITDLRSQIGEGVRTRQLVIVDEAGVARAHITAESGGDCGFVLFDDDGFERIRLVCKPDIGVVNIAGRSLGGEPTRVEMFALDRDEGDGAYIGVELVENGNSVAGFALNEGQPGRLWTDGD